MAHVPLDDARQLFQWTNPKTWAEFHKVVQEHKGKIDGISDALIDLMLPMSRYFEEHHTPFPNTPEALEQLLNHRLAESGHRGQP